MWRNRPFQTLWIGTSTSTLGVSVADIAYPLTILAITRSPALAGLFAAVQGLGMLAAGLPAGVLADRYDGRTIVIVTEAARAAVTAVMAVALITGWLSLPLLFTAAALLGAGQVIRNAAGLLLMRSVVPPEQLTQALTQDEVRMNGSALAGPALGGALYAIRALAHAIPFLFTAASFLVALVTATLMKRPAGQPNGTTAESRPAAARGSMLAGVRTLWNQPVLRAATMLIMFVNTIGAGLELVIIVILRHQAVPSSVIGLALGAGAAGGLAGAPLVKILHRLRPGVLLLAVCTLDAVILALLAVPFGPWWWPPAVHRHARHTRDPRAGRHPGDQAGPARAARPGRRGAHDADRPGRARRAGGLRAAAAVPAGAGRHPGDGRGRSRGRGVLLHPARALAGPLAG